MAENIPQLFVIFTIHSLHSIELSAESEVALEWRPKSQSGSFKEALELPDTSRMSHFAQGLCFDLTDTLPSDLELPPYFFQGSAISIDQAKSLLEDLPFAISKRLQHVLDFFLQQDNRSHVARIFGASVFDKIAKIRFFALTHRRLKGDWLLRHLEQLPHAIDWQQHFFGYFFGRRFASVFLHQLLLHAHEFINRLNHVHRH